MQRIPLVAALCGAAIALPLAVCAAAPGTNDFVAPKLVKRGVNTTPIGGTGIVIVKVLVNTNGTFKVQSVIKSTNHADDKAALEIAQTSTYKPATKGGKPQIAFYDFTLKFGAGGSTMSAVDTTELGQDERMIRAGNYSGAQAALKTYLGGHPEDQRAQVDLGVADSFLSDFEAAAAAFEKGGSVPANYRSVAGKSYAEAAIALANTKDYTKALGYAKHAVELSPQFATYNTLGFAEYGMGDFASATTDLQKARELGKSENVSGKLRASVDANLVAAYLGAGNVDMAKTVGAEGRQLDPSNTSIEVAFGNYYAKLAAVKMTAKQYSDAAGLYEQAAVAAPSGGANFYGLAALAWLRLEKPDNVKAKVDFDKALAIDPANSLANFAAGISLANLGKPKDALEYFKKADDAATKAGDADLAAAVEKQMKTLNGTK
jgi:tetratricopeptide (TPR) repeat protein